MHTDKDLLLIARPDHSYSLYQHLLQSSINFTYYSFKLFPLWTKRFITNKRVRYYGKNFSCCFLATLVHLARIKFRKGKWKRFEKPLVELHLRFSLPRNGAKVIHYWPNYCIDEVIRYKRKHPTIKTIADVFFPNERWVLDNVKPALQKRDLLVGNMESIERDAKLLDKVMRFEDNFFVPSRFVAETYKVYYPHKNYIIVPYGIKKWKNYKKITPKKDSKEISSFVYVGTISIEKGCDVLLNFFIEHNDLSIHLYGNISVGQDFFFESFHKYDNIFFHGTVPHSSIQNYIRQHDVGIHLSRYDAYSLAVSEIIGAGLPVIVSNMTGIADEIMSNNWGVVTSLDNELLNNAINKMRKVDIYNTYLESIDVYLSSPHKSYEETIIDEYIKLINNEQ